ncbi:Uncharacterised protein [Mycobacteroides abscessus subsp. abscessus]|nr:Uncharacterised protein [Mycobacteroides abscessus subsp. abscessus]
MLKKAAKRCHATPQTSFRPTSSRNRPPDIILMNAKTDTMIGLSGSNWATFMVTCRYPGARPTGATGRCRR